MERRRRFRPGGSIQSKLLVMLLVSSILAAAVVGFFGYRSGTSALRDSAYARLTELRDERSKAIVDFAASIRGAVVLDSQGIGVSASDAFNAAYGDLADATVTDEDRARIRAYYTDTFIPALSENVGGDLDPDAFIPSSPARSYLQAAYTSKVTDFDQAIQVDDAGDGSEWSAVNQRFNPYFRAAALELGLDDVLLLNNDGTVVYSAYKGSDLGSNVKRGEYRGGGLEKVFDEAVRSNSRDFVAVADFEQYQPAFGDPTFFLASPVGTAGDLTGVLVYEVSADKINAVMSGDPDPGTFRGLGDSGESFLIGPDADGSGQTMRSNSRELVEHPKEFARESVAQGTSEAAVERMVRTGSSILLQPSNSEASQRAAKGESGTIQTTDYLGHEVLDSYAPVPIDGLDWSIVTKLNTSEAFEPVNDFARAMLVATAAVVLLIAAASVLMARVFTSPLNRLIAGVRSVAAGDLGARVDAGSKDEFGDLAEAFNDMSASLRSKQDLLDAEQHENQQLLASLMPESVATRYRGGETGIVDEHQNVTVALVEVEGFDAFASRLPSAEALALRDSIARGIDEAGRSAGVDKVRSAGTSIVVSSGLVVQRVDHVRRVADFTAAVASLVDRFNAQNGSHLTVRGGIDTGTVRSGLLGPNGIVYDLWGEAVNLAYRLRATAGEPGVYVSDAVKERLGSAFETEQAGTVRDGDTERPVWRLAVGGA